MRIMAWAIERSTQRSLAREELSHATRYSDGGDMGLHKRWLIVCVALLLLYINIHVRVNNRRRKQSQLIYCHVDEMVALLK